MDYGSLLSKAEKRARKDLPAFGDELDGVIGQVLGGQREGLALAFLDVALGEEGGAAGHLIVLENLAPEPAVHVGGRGLDGELVLGRNQDVRRAAADGGVLDIGDGDVELGIGIGILVDLQSAIAVEAADDGVGHGHLEIGLQAGVPGHGHVDAADALEITPGRIAHAITRAAAKRPNGQHREQGQDGSAHCGSGVLSGGAGTG